MKKKSTSLFKQPTPWAPRFWAMFIIAGSIFVLDAGAVEASASTIYGQYLTLMNSSETGFRSLQKRITPHKSGQANIEIESISQRVGDGFRFTRQTTRIHESRRKYLRETVTLTNRSGLWFVYPSIKTAVRLKVNELNGADYSLDKSASVSFVGDGTIQSGDPCAVIKIVRPAGRLSLEVPVHRESSWSDRLLGLFKDKHKTQENNNINTNIYLSKHTQLPLRVQISDSAGKILSDIVYESHEKIDRQEEKSFDVPEGYTLKLPASPEEIKAELLTCELLLSGLRRNGNRR